MKGILIAGVACMFPWLSFAATNAVYVASDSPDAPLDANSNSVNVWTVVPSGNNDFRGSFLGNSSNNGLAPSGAGAGTSAWALYANSGNSIAATHTFSGGTVNVGQTVAMLFDNGWVETGGSVGIRLLLVDATAVFTFQFAAGNSKYQYVDAGGTSVTSEDFTDAGGEFSFTRTSANGYSASFGGASWTGSLSSGAITGIQVFNNNAGSDPPRDVFFNNLTIVPEPGVTILGGLGLLALAGRRVRQAKR